MVPPSRPVAEFLATFLADDVPKTRIEPLPRPPRLLSKGKRESSRGVRWRWRAGCPNGWRIFWRSDGRSRMPDADVRVGDALRVALVDDLREGLEERGHHV